MNRTIKFSEVKLCHHGHDMGKQWFVHFSAKNLLTGQIIRKQFREGINQGINKDERCKLANVVIAFWKQKIKQGYSPFEETIINKLENMGFSEALDFALSKCSASAGTKKAYKCAVKFLKLAAAKIFFTNMPMATIKRQHIKLILEQAQVSNKWTNGSFNKYLGYLHSILTILIDWEVIEHNPASNIKKLPVAETQKFIPFNEEEKNRIQEYIFLNHYRYWVILMVIYHTGIRPKEVLALKIKDVDLSKALITIVPDLQAENSKTKKIRKIPINGHLLTFLRQLELNKYPKDYYMFGSPYISGQGNRGSAKGGKSGAMHPEYFKPSPTQIKRDTITKLWKKIVIDNLKIDKHQYAMKHTGANAKILAGMDLNVLQELYGHSSKMMTLKYASAVKDVFRAEIIEKSPAF